MSKPKPPRKRLPMISFRADEEIVAVLARLEEALDESVVRGRRRSIAIRQALLEAGDRLGKK